MAVSVVIYLAAFVSAALAVNNYPIYNDLLELEAKHLNNREKREVGSICFDYNSCCDMSNAHDDDSMKICIEKLHIVGRPTEDEIKCIAECMAKTDGYMDENGVIDKSKFSEFLINKLSAYSDWLSQDDATSVVESCIKNIKTHSLLPNKECDDIAMTVGHCVAGKIQLHCPLDKQKSPEACAALQEYIRKHGGLPPSGQIC